MKFRKKRKLHSAVEAASLSDILFFLLLFFLMVATMASPAAIQVLLPKANKSEIIQTRKKIIRVRVDKDENYFIDKKQVELENFKDELSEKVTHGVETSVTLDIDKSVVSGKMIEVIDLVNQLKLPIVIASEKKKGGG
jgi:biopolymer transport protein ExbD